LTLMERLTPSRSSVSAIARQGVGTTLLIALALVAAACERASPKASDHPGVSGPLDPLRVHHQDLALLLSRFGSSRMCNRRASSLNEMAAPSSWPPTWLCLDAM
jgi:hypothetical protein